LHKRKIAVSSYQFPPDSDQKGGGTKINTGDAGLYNVVFRNGFLYTAHAIEHNWATEDVAAVRFYQISMNNIVAREITFGGDRTFYFYPAIMADSRGNIVVVYSRCSAAEFPGAFYTGVRVGETSVENSAVLHAGVAHYLKDDDSGLNRWGDYNGIASDPVNDSIWIFSEFAALGNKWKTFGARVTY